VSTAAAREWSEFQVLQKSYLFKRKAELTDLFKALSENKLEIINKQVSLYLENARMYDFLAIESQSRRVKESLAESGSDLIWAELNKLDIIVCDYLRQY